jgi:hypothetical protein
MICPVCKQKMYCYGGDDKNMLYTHTNKQECENKIVKPRARTWAQRRVR